MKIKKIELIFRNYGYNKEYKGYYARYSVKVNGENIENLFTEAELKKLPYWSNRGKVLAMTIWGSNQEFESKLAIAGFLKIGERLKKNWGKYCQYLDKIIKVKS